MPFFTTAQPRIVFAGVALSLVATVASAQNAPQAGVQFQFTTFTIPGATSVDVESINNSGTISGYYTDASSDTISFLRSSAGTITSYTEPADTSIPSFTQGGQVNQAGTVVGEFFNTAANTYEGYFYNPGAGKNSIYNVPGQPASTTTGVYGINNTGSFCGFVFPPPYTIASAFVKSNLLSIFQVNSSSTSVCYGINDSHTAVGYYIDSVGAYHGWMRLANGTTTTIDVPGASTTPAAAPCQSVSVAGTVVLGVNNSGYVSGHYWDSAYNEHGFIMTPAGKFIQVNVPGAYQTSGGGLNDSVTIVGHYVDSSCNSSGYIAKP